ILEQVRIANRMLATGEIPGGGRISNIVFMGMGEPLANYRPVATVCKRLNAPAPEGFGMSARHITVSTVGLAPAVRKLVKEAIPVTLAVSLHAPDDELRDELVPINTRFDVDEILSAAHEYFEATGRRVSIEYALIRDINDQAHRAQLLADKLIAKGGLHWAHVNPIPLNPVQGSKWTASEPLVEKRFVETLRDAGISATIRDTRGADIDGACGQRAAEVLETDTRRADREARVSVSSTSAASCSRPTPAGPTAKPGWPGWRPSPAQGSSSDAASIPARPLRRGLRRAGGRRLDRPHPERPAHRGRLDHRRAGPPEALHAHTFRRGLRHGRRGRLPRHSGGAGAAGGFRDARPHRPRPGTRGSGPGPARRPRCLAPAAAAAEPAAAPLRRRTVSAPTASTVSAARAATVGQRNRRGRNHW